ncbi:MAG: GNAT family N-acetyltransferase [Pirellulaceae bacterium]|nr:GNAT family N-acetyltransferase [Pirellulaceae bacterium]
MNETANVEILPMTSTHVDDVIALWNVTEGLILTSTDNLDDLQFYFDRNPGISQVAIHGKTVVGAALCGHDGRRGYLHHLAVSVAYRRQGIGRQLVAACLRELRRVGISQCNLFVVTDDDDAQRFWSNGQWQSWENIQLFSKTL